MSNWTIRCANDYLKHIYNRLQEILLSYHVNQCDETPVDVKAGTRAICVM